MDRALESDWLRLFHFMALLLMVNYFSLLKCKFSIKEDEDNFVLGCYKD